MTEHNYQDGRILLNIDRQYYSTLDIESFFLMMKDPSYCYKFYWLEAIVKLISRDVEETTFNELIDEMIVNAWYSVWPVLFLRKKFSKSIEFDKCRKVISRLQGGKKDEKPRREKPYKS